MSTPEGRIKAKVKRRLRDEFGTSHWPFWPVQTGYGSVALDLLGCFYGRFIAIETKADRTKKLTPLQETTAASIRLAGGLVLVVYDDETLEVAVNTIKWKTAEWKSLLNAPLPPR
jgi:hypothetical protein